MPMSCFCLLACAGTCTLFVQLPAAAHRASPAAPCGRSRGPRQQRAGLCAAGHTAGADVTRHGCEHGSYAVAPALAHAQRTPRWPVPGHRSWHTRVRACVCVYLVYLFVCVCDASLVTRLRV